ncbi:lamin tail domain-containing protein [Streptomyces puniciscabiei]|uniref:lamin tail domain-containing protein n=1 Tax=Streptomyces puniciscabiei TaxID=164348 RepID=UPI0006EB9370|nr:lamin tail domain-containing protein [Streptomyces puniciscabiei]
MSASSPVRRITAVAAVAAALVGAAALPAAAAGHQPGRTHQAEVYISGVQHAWQGRDARSNRSLNKQWVDITNSTRRAMNLDNWTLSDRDGHTYTFHHVLLAGRATVRVHTGIGRDTRTDLYQDRRTRVWDVNTDTATLRDARGRLVSVFAWGSSHRAVDTGRRDAAGRHHAGLRHHGAVQHLHHTAGQNHGDHVGGHRH